MSTTDVPQEAADTAESELLPYSPALIPLHQGWITSWLVSVESEMDPENYHAGWRHVHADARGREVELDGEVCSPTEARNLGLDLLQDRAAAWPGSTGLNPAETCNLAMALLQAADHAESYAHVVMGVLDSERPHGTPAWPDATIGQTRAVHEWIQRAHDRAAEHARRAQVNTSEVSR